MAPTFITDSFAPAYCSQRSYAKGVPCSDTPHLVEKIKDVMVAGGWTVTQELKAHGMIDEFGYYDGWGPPPKILWIYNPYSGNGVLVETTSNPGPSDGTVAADITSNTDYNATVQTIGGYVFWVLTVKDDLSLSPLLPPPFYNQPYVATGWFNPQFIGSTHLGVPPPVGPGPQPEIVYGGGYRMLSGLSTGNTCQYTIDVYGNDNGVVSLDLNFVGPTINSILMSSPTVVAVGSPAAYVGGVRWPSYSIIANPTTLAIVDEVNDFGVPVFENRPANSFFSTAPVLTLSKTPALSSCLFQVIGGWLSRQMWWDAGKAFVSTNNSPMSNVGSMPDFNNAGIMTKQFPFISPLLLPSGFPLAVNAYLIASSDNNDSTILGKIPDGAVATRGDYAINQPVSSDGHSFYPVCRQVGVPGSMACTLFLAID